MLPLVFFMLVGTAPVQSGESVQAEDVRTAVRKVYGDDLFGRLETRMVWVPIPREQDSATPSRRAGGSENLLGMILLSIATVVGIVLLVMLGGAIWRGRRQRAAGQEEPVTAPTVLFGLDVRPESLPADVIEAAWAAWQAGETLSALSLLYRAALATVIARAGIRIPRSATEGECVRAVKRGIGEPFGADFEALTSVWLVAAYARRPPASADFAALLERWRPHLETRRRW